RDRWIQRDPVVLLHPGGALPGAGDDRGRYPHHLRIGFKCGLLPRLGVRHVGENHVAASRRQQWASATPKRSGSREKSERHPMADVPIQVIVAAFHSLDGASKALKELQEAKRDSLIGIEDAAVITKDADGKVKIKETADMRTGKGATIGAITGGVVGLLAGPVRLAPLGGGVTGGLAAKLHDSGFPDARLKQLGAGLTPNSSALVAVIEHRWVAEVERQLAQQGADLATQALSDDIARQLKSGEDVVYTVV